jgi:hypothetical protein
MSRQFNWLTGMMVTMIVTVAGGLFAVVGALLTRS